MNNKFSQSTFSIHDLVFLGIDLTHDISGAGKEDCWYSL